MDVNSFSNVLSERVLAQGVLPDILDGLGFEHRTRRDGLGLKYVGACPIHQGDDPDHCVVYANEKVCWRCYSGSCHRTNPKVKASLLGFVRGCLSTREGHDVGFGAAVRFVEQYVGRSGSARIVRTPPAVITSPSPPRPGPSGLTPDQFRDEHDLLVPARVFARDRGFSPGLLGGLLVGYSKIQRRVLFPIFSDDGRTIVGYTSRTQYPECPRCRTHHYPDRECRWGQHHRWKTPEGFAIGRHLYAYHLARESHLPYVVLTEGIPDALRCLEAGHPAVACFGLDLTPEQRAKLVALGKAIVVGFDNDPQGRIGAGRIVQELFTQEVSCLAIPPAYKDLAEMPSQAARQLIHAHLA